jgi:hypothetical protein
LQVKAHTLGWRALLRLLLQGRLWLLLPLLLHIGLLLLLLLPVSLA